MKKKKRFFVVVDDDAVDVVRGERQRMPYGSERAVIAEGEGGPRLRGGRGTSYHHLPFPYLSVASRTLPLATFTSNQPSHLFGT